MKKIITILLLLSAIGVMGQQTEPVTLTVSGTGQTKDIAQKNALRKALEQSFGAFISSKTEILNDSLVREEIISVTNGYIIGYKILSELEIPGSGWATALSATVSVSKLTSYFENKGVEIEFKGNTFATNIKLQKLNEQAEYSVVYNLLDLGVFMLAKSVDFEISTSEPKFTGNEDLYNIQIKVDYKTNENRESYLTYFENTLSKLSMTETEINSYKSSVKPTYDIGINNGKKQNLYRLRNPESLRMIRGVFCVANAFLLDFGIYSEADTLFVKPIKGDIPGVNYKQYYRYSIATKPNEEPQETWYSLAYADNCHHYDRNSYNNLPIINFIPMQAETRCASRVYAMSTFLESFTSSLDYTYTGGSRRNNGSPKDNLNPVYIDYTYKPMGSWVINHSLSLKQMEKISKYKIVKHSPEFKQEVKNDTWLKWLYGIQ